jgi:hypothetical protein
MRRGSSSLSCSSLASNATDGETAIDQERWVTKAVETFGKLFGGATAFPKGLAAELGATYGSVWRDDANKGKLVFDEPIVATFDPRAREVFALLHQSRANRRR